MTAAMSKSRFVKAIEILILLAALGVLVENVSLFRQNRRLQEAAAPQIAAGPQLQMLSGLTLDGRIEPVSLPAAAAICIGDNSCNMETVSTLLNGGFFLGDYLGLVAAGDDFVASFTQVHSQNVSTIFAHRVGP